MNEREALRRIAAIKNKPDGGDWDEIGEARLIARAALASAPAATQGEHKPGCEALGGYGHGIGACDCGAASTPQPTAPARAAEATQPAAAEQAWVHKKSGGRYRLIGKALTQSDEPLPDLSPVVVYQGEDGELWVRSASEFRERFLPTSPSQAPAVAEQPIHQWPIAEQWAEPQAPAGVEAAQQGQAGGASLARWSQHG